MASTSHATNVTNPPPLAQPAGPERSLFEQQREALLGEIAISLEHVLQNINKLNRNLESAIAVGNEFNSVEALWSQFESVMVKDTTTDAETKGMETRDRSHIEDQEDRE